MSRWMYQCMNLVAQAFPRAAYDDSPPPSTTSSDKGMSFSDLQKGFRTQLNGNSQDSHYRHLLWAVVAIVVLFAIYLNLRQRRKTGGPPDSTRALAREISRCIRFPFGSRLILWWVARTGKVPMAALLISEELFTRHLTEWGQQPTFGPLRQWGTARLIRLQNILFRQVDHTIPASPESP